MNVSVGKLYAAAFGPGFLLAGLYMAYTTIRCHLNPKLGPPLPPEERLASTRAVLWEFAAGIVPLGVLILGTLGSILGGLATPTEAAAIGSTGALALALGYQKLDWKKIKTAGIKTVQTTSMIMFLAVASNIFGSVFAAFGAGDWMTKTLLALPLPPFMMLLMIMLLIFLLGWPFEWPAIIYLFLPLFLPVIIAMKFDMVWFGVLTAVNLQTAFLSPPVAMSAYYLKAVVPEWELSTIYRGMADFMILQVIGLILLIFFPDIALWLPRLLYE
jgi:tripartite ATP-independent transporter DctM subunit